MNKILDFLRTNRVFYLATADGDQPRVRPLGFVMEWEGKIAFCTSNQKPMCKQMAANPKVEISCIDADMNTLRITGKAAFITSEAAQRKALEVMPSLSGMYAVGDGKFEIFTLTDATATCATMTGETESLPL